MMRRVVIACLAVLGAAAGGCGEQRGGAPAGDGDPGPVHVHGMGVDPADGALMIATHTGLFRAPHGRERAERVGDRWQDTMGFTVIGRRRFLGSGHPDLRDDLPPFLGLIESRDAGRTWRPVSLQGEVDFHVLEAHGRRIYGYGSDWDSRRPVFLVSSNAGRTWRSLRAPEPLQALAIHPRDPDRLIASGPRGVHLSADGGRSWSDAAAPTPGLLVWTTRGVHLAAEDGRLLQSRDDGQRWQLVGRLEGQPAALDSGIGAELLVALHDGTVKRSGDGGRTWTLRSRP
jgi:photosystem II stability/assembly factor-like uncharacterized protein